MDGLDGIVGKKVIVFYNDFEKISRKEGTVIAYNGTAIFLSNKIIIPSGRIVRVEVQ